MTCGNRRGLVDMDVQVQGIAPEVYLLPGTNLSGIAGNDYGIATESNVNYKYALDNPLYDYYNSRKSELLQGSNSSKVLNEKQIAIDVNTYNNALSASGGKEGSKAIQLTPTEWIEESHKFYDVNDFNAAAFRIRVVYEFELDQKRNIKAVLKDDTSGATMLPLNDLLDLCVKSMFKKSKKNNAIPGNLTLEHNQATHSYNVDQYFVFDQNPVSFCQFKGDAFLISQHMTTEPYRMKSNLIQQLKSGLTNNAHSFQLVQDQLETVLYPSPASYGVETYAQQLENVQLNTAAAVRMMTPARYIHGVKYNYIVEIEQNKNPNKQFDNPTIYDNGDVFGFFTVGKNMYNSLYSMQMDDASTLANCREYVGVQGMGNKVMLKFYDSCTYGIDAQDNASMLSTSSSVIGKYPYQKIETYEPLKFGHVTKHKSNLFSLKISNSGLDEESLNNCTAEQRHTAQSLKKSISNAMKHLVLSIAPANTQLFTTYFQENE